MIWKQQGFFLFIKKIQSQNQEIIQTCFYFNCNVKNSRKNCRGLHKQLENYLGSGKLLYDYQSGFKNSYSTDSWHLADRPNQIWHGHRKLYWHGHDRPSKIYRPMAHILSITTYFWINWKLLDNLSKYWFSSYFKNRFQKTELDGIFSDFMVVPCGVGLPQGSILGPFRPTIPNFCKRYGGGCRLLCRPRLILYADDSALLVSSSLHRFLK